MLHPEEAVADNKLTSVVSCQYTVVLIVQMYVSWSTLFADFGD